jgi:hypothetical protein
MLPGSTGAAPVRYACICLIMPVYQTCTGSIFCLSTASSAAENPTTHACPCQDVHTSALLQASQQQNAALAPIPASIPPVHSDACCPTALLPLLLLLGVRRARLPQLRQQAPAGTSTLLPAALATPRQRACCKQLQQLLALAPANGVGAPLSVGAAVLGMLLQRPSTALLDQGVLTGAAVGANSNIVILTTA